MNSSNCVIVYCVVQTCRNSGLYYTVATGVTGEPAAPGILSGGAVSKKLLRLF